MSDEETPGARWLSQAGELDLLQCPGQLGLYVSPEYYRALHGRDPHSIAVSGEGKGFTFMAVRRLFRSGLRPDMSHLLSDPAPVRQGNVWHIVGYGSRAYHDPRLRGVADFLCAQMPHHGIDILSLQLREGGIRPHSVVHEAQRGFWEELGFERLRYGRHAHWRDSPGFDDRSSRGGDERGFNILYAHDLRPMGP